MRRPRVQAPTKSTHPVPRTGRREGLGGARTEREHEREREERAPAPKVDLGRLTLALSLLLSLSLSFSAYLDLLPSARPSLPSTSAPLAGRPAKKQTPTSANARLALSTRSLGCPAPIWPHPPTPSLPVDRSLPPYCRNGRRPTTPLAPPRSADGRSRSHLAERRRRPARVPSTADFGAPASCFRNRLLGLLTPLPLACRSLPRPSSGPVNAQTDSLASLGRSSYPTRP